MNSLSPNLRAIVLMIAATAVFVINDTFLKLVTNDLPPFQTLFMRGVSGSIWGIPLVLLTGNRGLVRHVADKWVVMRNVAELFAVLCFIVALKNMPIADITALGQVAPMLMLLLAWALFRERIGAFRLMIIALGFAGALMVAQPSAPTASPFAVLAIGLAVGTAIRDLLSRQIPTLIPGPIVAFSALLIVMLGALVAHLSLEQWVTPKPEHYVYLAFSGFFLTIGHLCIFLAYRTGAIGAVAPFFYMFTVWAVISGLVVFGTFPNALAIAGILLIVGSGVAIVLLDERKRRLRPVA